MYKKSRFRLEFLTDFFYFFEFFFEFVLNFQTKKKMSSFTIDMGGGSKKKKKLGRPPASLRKVRIKKTSLNFFSHVKHSEMKTRMRSTQILMIYRLK